MLDTGDAVVALPRQNLTGAIDSECVAVVPIGDHRPDETARLVDDPVVDRPRVDTERLRAHRLRLLEAVDRCSMQAPDIPGPAPAGMNRSVGKPAHLGQGWHPGREIGQDDAATPRADVDGRYPSHGGYRMNAAATPESTGMIRPVVRENSSETIAATAVAMCSGRTSRLRMVRCA